jgi:hypothetical protein
MDASITYSHTCPCLHSSKEILDKAFRVFVIVTIVKFNDVYLVRPAGMLNRMLLMPCLHSRASQ